MLPLYALLAEWALFRFCSTWPVVFEKNIDNDQANTRIGWLREQTYLLTKCDNRDWRVIGLFLLVLAAPMVLGLTWLLPGLLKPEAWATRDFTLSTRLLSEARIIVDYIGWTLLPTPSALSFYPHRNPWTLNFCRKAYALAR